VAAGTPLRGLNFMKDKSDPLAMEDSQYPDWLWTILKDQQGAKLEEALEKKSKPRRGLDRDYADLVHRREVF